MTPPRGDAPHHSANGIRSPADAGVSSTGHASVSRVDLEDLYEPEWVDWFRLTPQERWRETARLWHHYVAVGGSLDPEPDPQSPFYDPDADPLGVAYQQAQSVTAIGSGQLTGKGLFDGALTNLRFVPEQETDFIFTAVGEQLGFLGSALVIAAFVILLWRAFVIAATARDRFGSLMAVGIGSMIMFQVFVNIGMTMKIMPVTGLPLPFLSYGGSSLLTFAFAMGLLNSIWRPVMLT